MDNIFYRDAEIVKRIPEMFDRTEDMVIEDINSIKEWLKTQPQLPELMSTDLSKSGDTYIRNFLLINKFSVEKTKRRIDMYYTIRSLIPDFFDECNPNNPYLKEARAKIYLLIHPKPIEGLYRTFFFRLKEPNTVPAKEFIMQTFNIAELRLQEDITFGEIFILDMANFTFNDMKKFTPNLLNKAFIAYERVYALRMRGMYIINSPSYVSMLMSIFKALLKPKIFDRIHVCKNSEILKTLFSKEELPQDYGGEGPSLNTLQEMIDLRFQQYKHRFDLLDKLRVNESLRPEKLNNDEILGYYGNFKKLNVD